MSVSDAKEVAQQLDRVANAANNCVYDPASSFQYDAMSDSIIWTDEIPDPSQCRFSESSILRILQRYRTSVWIRNPEEMFSVYWEVGQEIFPSWPGFHSSRLEASPERLTCFF